MKSEHPSSRPIRVDDLVQRLMSTQVKKREKDALRSLSVEMVRIFRQDPRLGYMREAAALSLIIPDEAYKILTRTFNRAMIQGTADGNSVDPLVSNGFSQILRREDSANKASMELGLVMQSLLDRLQRADLVADRAVQYQLVCALASVLDALNDNKTEGLNREKSHQPLLEMLGKLTKEKELRLSQMACYTLQALISIPNDESTFAAITRNTTNMLMSVSKVAGGVATFDPSKLLEGGLSLIEQIPDIILKLNTMVTDTIDAAVKFRGAFDDFKDIGKQKLWFCAIRYASLFIQSEDFVALTAFIDAVPCKDQEEFLCGVFAELEHAWIVGTLRTTKTSQKDTQNAIEDFLENFMIPIGKKSNFERVREWTRQTAITIHQIDIIEDLEPVPGCWPISPVKDKALTLVRRSKFGRKLFKTSTKFTHTIPCRGTPEEELPSYLIEAAWRESENTKRFYADARIQEYYFENGRLDVERLSGERLSMDQCYINLSLNYMGSNSNEIDYMFPKDSPFSLFNHLNVETPAVENQVNLQSLFNERKKRNGTRFIPQRISIRGQAGVGKTTLCKKIVYDFCKGNLWNHLFDRVIWVPLRKLKGTYMTKSFEQWLCDEYFHELADDDILAAAVKKVFLEHVQGGQKNDDRTLFILDGLDEVADDLTFSETPNLLGYLLKKSHVIVVSRPHKSILDLIKPVDLELETVGFYPEQVYAYIRNSSDHADEIIPFLQESWLLEQLVRIPIQLDALCYSWEPSARSNRAISSMTGLYLEVESKLRRKDVSQLEIRSRYAAENALVHDIEAWTFDEISFLKGLAFNGLCTDLIEFDESFRNETWKTWDKILQSRLSRNLGSHMISKFAFLRSSSAASSEKNREYHFLHLTFQEFFAASYFVDCWTSNIPLVCLKRNKTGLNSIYVDYESVDTKTFLQKEKYTARYNIFWRFVSGLLQRDENHLCDFFTILNEEPRDIIGPTHQRLMMHCLSEIQKPKAMPKFSMIQAELERQLVRWIKFECKLLSRSSLANEMECPARIIEMILQNALEDERIKILESIADRVRLSPGILTLLTSFLRDYLTSTELIIAILEVLERRPQESFADETIHAIVDRLKNDKDEYVREIAANVLDKRSSLPETAMADIITLLVQNKDHRLREQACVALHQQSNLSDVALEVLSELLDSDDSNISTTASSIIRRHSSLSDEFLLNITTQLKSKNDAVGSNVAATLSHRLILPQTVFDKIRELLNEENSVEADSVVQALASTPLSLQIIDAVAKVLDEANPRDEDALLIRVINVLGAQRTLSDRILINIVSKLRQSHSKFLRSAVESAIQHQPILSSEVLLYIILLFKEEYNQESDQLRRSALLMLGMQSALSEDVLQQIITLINDGKQSEETRDRAVAVLGNQILLPDNIFLQLRNLLKSTDSLLILGTALRTRNQQLVSSHEFTQAAINRLQDESKWLKLNTLNSLSQHNTLTFEIVEQTARLINSEDMDVRISVMNLLQAQTVLPLNILEIMTQRLNHKEESVIKMSILVTIRHQQAPLSMKVQRAILSLLGPIKDRSSEVRVTAVRALLTKAPLSIEVVEAYTRMLQDKTWMTRDDSFEIIVSLLRTLSRHTNLPQTTLTTIVSLLSSSNFEEMQLLGFEALSRQSILTKDIFLKLKNSKLEKDAYRTWLTESFYRHLTLCVSDEGWSFARSTGNNLVLLNKEDTTLMDRIKELQSEMGVPIEKLVVSW